MGPLRAAVLSVILSATPAAAPPPRQPLGVVEQTLGRFDRDTLAPVRGGIPIGEPHAAPVLSPDGSRLAVGVSESPPPGTPGTGGRVGLWIVDPERMRIVHRVRTGIAVEAVAFPGVVAGLAQDGRLLVVDPDTGAIVRTRRVGYDLCGPDAVRVGSVAVFVTRILRDAVGLATVDAAGRIRTATIRLRTGEAAPGCRRAPLVADPARRRVIVAGASRLAAIDVATLRARFHRIGDVAADRTLALVRGSLLAVAGERGLRVLDVRTWRTRWRARAARSVVAGGTTVVALGGGVRARDAATGRLRWRTRDRSIDAAVAAGRVYVAAPRRLRIRDLESGRLVGTRPPVLTRIRFVPGS